MNDNEPQGKADPSEWANGGVQDLRDPHGGAYGEITPTGTTDRKSAPDELPEGLKHARKGPVNKTTGRRPAG